MKKLVSLSVLVMVTTVTMVGCASQQEKPVLGDAKLTPIPESTVPVSPSQTIPSNPNTGVISNTEGNIPSDSGIMQSGPESNANKPPQSLIP